MRDWAESEGWRHQEAETKLVELLAQKLNAPLEVAGQEIRRLSQNRWLQPERLDGGFLGTGPEVHDDARRARCISTAVHAPRPILRVRSVV